MPLRGLVHDSPIITGIQKMTRRGVKHHSAARYVEETQWVDEMVFSFAKKVVHKLDKLIENKGK